MFYRPGLDPHGLPHDPFKACVVPRPIGWISSLSPEGVANLAPFSFFNAVASNPPTVVFATNGRGPAGVKDTRSNCERQGEFVVNLASYDLRSQVSESSAAVGPEVDEFDLAGLHKQPAVCVAPPRVTESPIHLECKYHQTVVLPGDDNYLVIGVVVGIHIDERVLTDGLVDIAKLRPLSRLGYLDYAVTDEVFAIRRPKA